MTAIEKLFLILGIKDQATPGLAKIQKAILAVGGAYLSWQAAKNIIGGIIKETAEYDATMQSLRAVATATGRDMNEIYAAMESQLGGVASKVSLASGFLKGMTTELSVEQINNLTTSIRDASIAMGENFQTQFPMIIKAIKQLNPAILDNIGVTVRLDQVNKKIREGYYGLSREINEATQQHAIYIEILRQTAKYQGQEKASLETAKGAWQELTASISNLAVAVGQYAKQDDVITKVLKGITWYIEGFTGNFKKVSDEFALAMESQLQSLYKEIGLLPVAEKATQSYSDALNTLLEALEKEQTELDNATQAWLDYNAAVAAGQIDLLPLAGEKLNEAYDKMIMEGIEDRSSKTIESENYVARQMVQIQQEGMAEVLAAYDVMLQNKLESSEETDRRTVDYLIKRYTRANTKMSFIAQTMAEGYMYTMSNAADNVANNLIDAMNGIEVSWVAMCKQMYEDLVKYLIKKAIIELAKLVLTGGGGGGGGGGAIGDWVDIGGIFGKPAVAPSGGGSPAPAMVNYNYQFTGPMTDPQYVNTFIAPIMERAARSRNNSMQLRPRFVTGEVINGR